MRQPKDILKASEFAWVDEPIYLMSHSESARKYFCLKLVLTYVGWDDTLRPIKHYFDLREFWC